jgi:hypothetical protein
MQIPRFSGSLLDAIQQSLLLQQRNCTITPSQDVVNGFAQIMQKRMAMQVVQPS